MTSMTLDAHSGTAIEFDVCAGCHVFWFDNRESVRLAPAATLRLFSLIGEHGSAQTSTRPQVMRCPRCRRRIAQVQDMQRQTRFTYWRCPLEHGRLITFLDFLREKDFIRPLSQEQIKQLKDQVQVVHCSSCGAPIDLVKDTTCGHCRSPLSMLDMQQAARVVEQLKRASEPRTIDPALAREVERARRETESAFAQMEQGAEWWRDVSSTGLVESSLLAIGRWLKTSRG